MKEGIFITADGTRGHLEYVGEPLTTAGSIYSFRREVRETRAGFEVHDVTFRKVRGNWHEDGRDVFETYESKLKAIEAVKEHEKSWFECVRDELKEQLERKRIEDGYQRIEAGRELDRISRDAVPGRATRDIVDMDFDDGLTPKQALELEKRRLKPIGFLGKDILAIEVSPAIQDAKSYRQELADEFRKAIEALPPMPDKTCDWCGADIHTPDYYRMVDRQFMCRGCHDELSR